MIHANLGTYRGRFGGWIFAVLSLHLSHQSSPQTQKKEHFCPSLLIPFKYLLKTIQTTFEGILYDLSDHSSDRWSKYRHSSRWSTSGVLYSRLYIRPLKSLSKQANTSLLWLFSRARNASVCLACLYVCACVIIRRAAFWAFMMISDVAVMTSDDNFLPLLHLSMKDN